MGVLLGSLVVLGFVCRLVWLVRKEIKRSRKTMTEAEVLLSVRPATAENNVTVIPIPSSSNGRIDKENTPH